MDLDGLGIKEKIEQESPDLINSGLECWDIKKKRTAFLPEKQANFER